MAAFLLRNGGVMKEFVVEQSFWLGFLGEIAILLLAGFGESTRRWFGCRIDRLLRDEALRPRLGIHLGEAGPVYGLGVLVAWARLIVLASGPVSKLPGGAEEGRVLVSSTSEALCVVL